MSITFSEPSCLVSKAVVLSPGCTLESLGELLKLPVPRLPSRTIASEFWDWDSDIQLLRLPRFQGAVEYPENIQSEVAEIPDFCGSDSQPSVAGHLE